MSRFAGVRFFTPIPKLKNNRAMARWIGAAIVGSLSLDRAKRNRALRRCGALALDFEDTIYWEAREDPCVFLFLRELMRFSPPLWNHSKPRPVRAPEYEQAYGAYCNLEGLLHPILANYLTTDEAREEFRRWSGEMTDGLLPRLVELIREPRVLQFSNSNAEVK